MRGKLRVLVVDDSPFMRQLISNVISSCEDMEVVGIARNGEEAIEKCQLLKPDVITLDIEMPILDGLQALTAIMRDNPTPVIMVSSLTQQGAKETFRALEIGAVDFITKPDRLASTTDLPALLIPKIRAASGARKLRVTNTQKLPQTFIARQYDLVLIGCSTGGPAALQKIVSVLPKDLAVPIVVAQHIPAGYTAPMAQRLTQLSQVKVVEAYDGIPLEKGLVYIAPGAFHTAVRKEKNRRYLQVLPPQHAATPFRPSVDVLFQSAASFAQDLLAVVLTGMGQDGLDGARVLSSQGAHIIAESEETAVVYGMPRAVAEAQLANAVWPLGQIAEFLQTVTKK